MYIDGQIVGTFTFNLNNLFLGRITTSYVRSGPHAVTLVFNLSGLAQDGIFFGYIMSKQTAGLDVIPQWLDARNCDEVSRMVLGGPYIKRSDFDAKRSRLGGLKVHFTEYGLAYENPGSQAPVHACKGTMLEAVGHAEILMHWFLRFTEIEAANHWGFTGDGNDRGEIEGIAFDVNKNEIGRTNARPRPIYYVNKLYWHLCYGPIIEPQSVNSDYYTFSKALARITTPLIENSYSSSIDIPYITSIAAKNSSSSMTIFVNSKYFEESTQVTFTINNRPSGTASITHYAIRGTGGKTAWANNEPDTCPDGQCVKIIEETPPTITQTSPLVFVANIAPCSVNAIRIVWS